MKGCCANTGALIENKNHTCIPSEQEEPCKSPPSPQPSDTAVHFHPAQQRGCFQKSSSIFFLKLLFFWSVYVCVHAHISPSGQPMSQSTVANHSSSINFVKPRPEKLVPEDRKYHCRLRDEQLCNINQTGMMLLFLFMQSRRGSRKQELGRKGQIQQNDRIPCTEHEIQNKLSSSFLCGTLKPGLYPLHSAALCHSRSTFLIARCTQSGDCYHLPAHSSWDHRASKAPLVSAVDRWCITTAC